MIPCTPPGRESVEKPIGSRIREKMTINIPLTNDSEKDEKKVSFKPDFPILLKISDETQSRGTKGITKNICKAQKGDMIQISRR